MFVHADAQLVHTYRQTDVGNENRISAKSQSDGEGARAFCSVQNKIPNCCEKRK